MFDGFVSSESNYDFGGKFLGGALEEEDRICPKCKTRESDVKETGTVGCANCYKVFRDTVSRTAYRYHGRLEHLGKVPVKHVSKAEKEREIEELHRLMVECASKEDFEGASAYKRKIESLKGEL